MLRHINYNVMGYINSIFEVKNMTLDGIINTYHKCKKYTLNETVADYLQYIEKEPFYISPSFGDVKTNIKQSTLKPKFVLFSAPGATGKSSLAKYIAHRFDAIYWNLAKVKIGTNSFAGSILNAVGATKYSEFISDLNTGDVLLVIDAFDEAEIVSGRRMLSSFIAEISDSMAVHQMPTVFLLARTETAQYIASFCTDNDISVAHYEIGFFGEEAAKEFILRRAIGKKDPTTPDLQSVASFYDVIKNNITDSERASFLGYAPVLEAISTHIKAYPNRQKLISELASQTDCVSVIMKILDDLLTREQNDKVVPAFRSKCQATHPEFTEWDKVYSAEEQLVRVIYYVLFGDTSYTNYDVKALPLHLIDEYQTILDSFLPQHPFVRNSVDAVTAGKTTDFTGPAFRDYTLAKIILDQTYNGLADMYFEESQCQSYFPSQIFFDCYTNIADNVIHPGHISYVYDSFKAKATAYEHPYLQCSEIPKDELEESSCEAVFGMTAGKQATPKRDDYCATITPMDAPLQFEQLSNVSIDTPTMDVSIGRKGLDARIYNSSIISRKIIWSTRNVVLESYDPESCLIVAREGFDGDSVTIDITKADNLKVCAPNLGNYYRLLPYSYDFEDTSSCDIIKFIHALRCILIEFRAHRKDSLAKSAERIENVTVGNSTIKRQVLNYMKDCGIIYSSEHLYKINEARMQEKGISFNGLLRMDTQLLQPAFLDFCKWENSQA